MTTPSCRGGASEDLFTIYIQQHIIIIIMCPEIRKQYYFTLNNKLFKLKVKVIPNVAAALIVAMEDQFYFVKLFLVLLCKLAFRVNS